MLWIAAVLVGCMGDPRAKTEFDQGYFEGRRAVESSSSTAAANVASDWVNAADMYPVPEHPSPQWREGYRRGVEDAVASQTRP